MQLTPRNLVMACGAILAGGAVFGVVTTLAPGVSLPTANPATPTAMPTGSAVDLGDEEITFPASPAPTRVSWPTPVASSAVLSPIVPTPSASPTTNWPASIPTASPTPVATSSSPAPRPRATARTDSGQATRTSRTSRPIATATATRRPAPAPAAAPTPRRTAATGGWQAPNLRAGANAITLPRLSSKATVRVTVGCSPSRACHISGDQLVIDPAATSVTVTWSAPASGGYRSWRVSRVL